MRTVRANEPEISIERRPPPPPSSDLLGASRLAGSDPVPIPPKIRARRKRRKSYHVIQQTTELPEAGPDAMTAIEVAEVLGMTAQAARYRLARSGIRAIKRTQWKRMSWPRTEVMEWIAKLLTEVEE